MYCFEAISQIQQTQTQTHDQLDRRKAHYSVSCTVFNF